jgi:hypothetical protein
MCRGWERPRLAACRVGSAALVAPTPGTPKYLENIWHGYFTDLRWIQAGSVQHQLLIHIAAATDIHTITISSTGEPMSRLKLEHGVSRIRRAKLQSSIDQTVADDIELLSEWSNNETNYIINELLRFALTQEEDFQKYKASAAVNAARVAIPTKSTPTPIKPVSEPSAKPDATISSAAAHA